MKKTFRMNDDKPLQLADRIRSLPIGMKNIMINLVELEKGAVLPGHSHEEEQVSLVIEGELEFEICGEKTRMGPGEGILCGSGEPHSAVALEKTLVYDVFSPPRYDYLERLKNSPGK